MQVDINYFILHFTFRLLSTPRAALLQDKAWLVFWSCLSPPHHDNVFNSENSFCAFTKHLFWKCSIVFSWSSCFDARWIKLSTVSPQYCRGFGHLIHPGAASRLSPAVSGAGLQGRLAQFLCLRHVLLPGTPCAQPRQHLSTSFGCQVTNTRHHAQSCLATTPSDNAEGEEMASGKGQDPGAAAQHTSLAPVCQ